MYKKQSFRIIINYINNYKYIKIYKITSYFRLTCFLTNYYNSNSDNKDAQN